MPKMHWLKQKIKDWFDLHQIPKPSNFEKMTKPELIQLSKYHPIQTKYLIEELAESSGKDIKVLWLPVGHCEFNAIELIWARMKHYVSTHNNGKSLNEIYHLSLEALSEIRPEIFKKCVEHVKTYENKMWKRDRLVEDMIEQSIQPIVIRANFSDDDTTDESDDDFV